MMAYRRAGMGACACPSPQGVPNILNSCCWDQWWNGPTPRTVAPPKAPADLITPPASGQDAQATVDDLVNQQLADQKALNAGSMSTSWWGSVYGSAADAASGASSGLGLPNVNWWLVGGVAFGAIFLATALGAGGPRRYGR